RSWCGFVLGCLLPSLLPGWPGSWSRFKIGGARLPRRVPGMGAFVRRQWACSRTRASCKAAPPYVPFDFFELRYPRTMIGAGEPTIGARSGMAGHGRDEDVVFPP